MGRVKQLRDGWRLKKRGQRKDVYIITVCFCAGQRVLLEMDGLCSAPACPLCAVCVPAEVGSYQLLAAGTNQQMHQARLKMLLCVILWGQNLDFPFYSETSFPEKQSPALARTGSFALALRIAVFLFVCLFSSRL